ncbi:MAG: hypothetical protein AAF658_07055 [Myxococcota bacterium]
MSFRFWVSAGSKDMMRHTEKFGLFALILAAVGCGEITNDDLLFLAAVPTSEELEIVVDDAELQVGSNVLRSAQVGEPSEIYVVVSEVARELNLQVDGLLALVNSLGRDVTPTEREDDRRVWGPFIDENGTAVRLEIFREDQMGAPRYTYCFHAALPEAVQGDPRCSPDRNIADNSNGWRAVLYGAFSPLNAVEGARTGDGVMTLDFIASREGGIPTDPNDQGRVTYEYEFTEGGATKQLDLTITTEEEEIPGLDTLFWSYALEANGNVAFYIEFPANLDTSATEAPELFQIDSCWNLDGPGRATVLFTEGDLPPSTLAQATECWDAGRLETYTLIELDDVRFEAGDLAACPTRCPLGS